MALPTISATLDDTTRVSSELVVQPGVTVQVTADTDDLDDGTLVLEVSTNRSAWKVAQGPTGALVQIVGDESTQSIDLLFKNDGRDAVYFRWRIQPVVTYDPVEAPVESVIVGEAAVTMLSPYVASLDLGYLPEYEDNAAALAAGESIGAAYADATGAIFRVIAA